MMIIKIIEALSDVSQKNFFTNHNALLIASVPNLGTALIGFASN